MESSQGSNEPNAKAAKQALRTAVFSDPPAGWPVLYSMARALPAAAECSRGIARVDRGAGEDISFLANREDVTGLYVNSAVRSEVDLPHVTDLYLDYDFRSTSGGELAALIHHLPALSHLDLGQVSNGEMLDLRILGGLDRLEYLRASSKNVDPADGANCSGFDRLKGAYFYAGRKSDIAWLERAPRLHSLWIEGASNLGSLLESPTIERLSIVDCAAAVSLGDFNMPLLRELHIGHTKVPSAEGVARLLQLSRLTFSFVDLVDLSPLAQCKQLRCAKLVDHRVVPSFGEDEFPSLRSFTIDNRGVLGFQLPNAHWVSKMPELEELLLDVELGDTDLTQVEALPNLRRLKLFGQYEREQLSRLQSRADFVLEVQLPAGQAIATLETP